MTRRDRWRIRAVHDVEAADPSRAAAGSAGEQTGGTFAGRVGPSDPSRRVAHGSAA